ncbi:retropepsin-like aspartic protease [Streptomyces sp. NPDC047706]|uniref:retropepsin-like aspartic protease n=1 Tax=Streptomyces sp. NPDC047706 TaxID=3365486 RepID=UPI003714830D
MSTRDARASGARHRRKPGRAAALLAALLLAGCLVPQDSDDRGDGRASRTAAREVPLRVQEQFGQTLAFVPVSIEGQGPFMFALDTGASMSVVDDDVADRAGLERTGERRAVSGILSTGEVAVVEVTHWEVGDLPLAPGELTLIDLGPPPGGGTMQGLLGSDVLSDFGSITIDYDEGVLEIPAS